MASCRHSSRAFESPAKVFAKMKSRVQREAMRADEGGFVGKEPTFAARESVSPPGSVRLHHRFAQVKALTLSPVKSPKKSHSLVGVPRTTSAGNGFRSTNAHLESTAVFGVHVSPDRCSSRDPAACGGTTRTPEQEPVDQRWTKALEREMDAGADRDEDSSNTEELQREEGCPATADRDRARPQHAKTKGCSVSLRNIMSPAKIFACMKKRESRREPEQDRDACREPPHDGGHFPASSLDKMGEGDACRSDLNSESPVSQPRPKFGNCQSEGVQPEEASSSVEMSEPILFEDPIVLNTPRVTIPKSHTAVFKKKQWPNPKSMPAESVIHLKKWFLRRNRKGLFVDGIRVGDNTPWNSNIVVERVSSAVLKTVSGRVYILEGKLNMDVDSEFPMWLLRRFVNGFPANWKELFGKFLSESKDSFSRGQRFYGKGRRPITRTTSETTALRTTVKQSKKNPVRTSDSCLPCSSSSSTKVSRSGRLIKPPLEYWKGGRVILDADMNVTVFECYDSSICNYKQVTPVSSGASRKSTQDLQHNDKGHKLCKSNSDGELQVPLRKVKAPLRKHKQIQPKENPSVSNRAAVRRRTHPPTSSDEQSSNEKKLPSQNKTKNHHVQGSKKKSDRAEVSQLRVSLRKRTNTWVFDDDTLANSAEGEDVFIPKRMKPRQKGRKLSTPGSCTEESEKELRKPERAPKTIKVAQVKPMPTKSVKAAPPAKAPADFAQPKKNSNKGRTAQSRVGDEHTWTQDEITRLQEAVSKYPKYMSNYWEKVAMMVGTHSAKECYTKHMVCIDSPSKRAHKTKNNKVEMPKDQDCPLISAKVGTLKRKQQVRQFLEALPRENMDDAFSSTCMQNKRFEVPFLSSSKDEDFTLGNVAPMTPISSGFPEVKTPQCLSITPGMMVSPNSNNNDKYVFQLQKRLKINQLNVHKQVPAKDLSPTPVKRTMKRCDNPGNNSFVVWEMFPEKASVLSESGEEDFYFSDDD